MKVPKLTKKAQDIVNQIMSADAVDIDNGRVDERVYYGQMHLTGEGLECNVNVNGDMGELIISNESLNAAVVSDGNIEIEFSDITITLYKLSKINAL